MQRVELPVAVLDCEAPGLREHLARPSAQQPTDVDGTSGLRRTLTREVTSQEFVERIGAVLLGFRTTECSWLDLTFGSSTFTRTLYRASCITSSNHCTSVLAHRARPTASTPETATAGGGASGPGGAVINPGRLAARQGRRLCHPAYRYRVQSTHKDCESCACSPVE